MKKDFRNINENFENAFTEVSESNIDEKKFIVKNICIFGRRESRNGYVYQDQAIAKIAGFTEGSKAFLNHPTKQEQKDRQGVRDIKDFIGVYRNVKYQKQEAKIFADLHCRESSFPLVRDIAKLTPSAVGNSINARVKIFTGEDGREAVVDIDRLNSCDLVSSTACTDNIFESKSEETKTDEEEIRFRIFENIFEQKMDNLLIKEGILKDEW